MTFMCAVLGALAVQTPAPTCGPAGLQRGAHLGVRGFREVAPVHAGRGALRQRPPQVLVHVLADEGREGRHDLRSAAGPSAGSWPRRVSADEVRARQHSQPQDPGLWHRCSQMSQMKGVAGAMIGAAQ